MRQKKEVFPYADIIQCGRPISKSKRTKITPEDRAAQFSPFDTLKDDSRSGTEVGQIPQTRISLSEDEKSFLYQCLFFLSQQKNPVTEVTIIYFLQNSNQPGGSYVTVLDTVQTVDFSQNIVILSDGTIISIEDIIYLGGDFFRFLGLTSTASDE